MILFAGCSGLPGRSVDPNQINYASYTLIKYRMTLPKGSVIRDCGPEALSAVFRHYGRKISVDEISGHIYSAQLKATPVPKVLAYLTDIGFRYTVKHGSIADIRAAIQENRPVITMIRINANISHFFVVAGYSDEEKMLLCPYYDNNVLLIHYADFTMKWEGADNFLLDIQPIDDPFDRAERAERSRQYREAIEHYEKALKTDPENYRAWVGIGNCRAYLSQPAEARAAYEKAMATNPNDPQLLNNLADTLVTLKADLVQAVELAGRAIAKYERAVANIQTYAKNSKTDEERAERLAQLEQATKYLSFAHGTLGQALLASRRFDEGLSALQKSFELLPPILKTTRAKRLREMADCHRGKGDSNKAAEMDKRADDLLSGQ